MLSIQNPTTKPMRAARGEFRRGFTDRSGVTAIEYGLIAGLIAVAIIAAVTLLGGDLSATFNSVASHLGNSL